MIQTSSPFPYKSEKVVPWKYDTNLLRNEQEQRQIRETRNTEELVVDNIVGIGGMTRSGRLFTPPELRNEEGHKNGVTKEKAKNLLKEKTQQVEEEPEGEAKKEISDAEACEFLKFIQQSEYKVVDQLNRMPARISLLELLMHSTSHQKLLMKILSEAHVEQDISLGKFEGIVSHITANNYLTFTKDEIPLEGRGHNKALHISVKCMNYAIVRVLIDNGSSLNVMPKTTLDKLPCGGCTCAQVP